MSNDVQSHESVEERLPGEERRASPRHAATTLGSVTARLIGGSPVDLVNFSARGVLFECDSRLLIGARASVRITTPDSNLVVSGRVVRSRVKGLVNGALRYDAALALDQELTLRPVLPISDAAPAPVVHANGDEADDVAFESELDGSFAPAPVEAYLAESAASLAEVAGAGTAEDEAIALFEGGSEIEEPPPLEAAVIEAGNVHVEVAVRATLEAAEPVVAVDAAVEAAADEPIAFEADAEVAFEAVDEFVFEETPEPDVLVATAHEETGENAGVSIFDATPYTPPAEEAVESASMFESTPPRPAFETSVSSMFDARPSDDWRAPGTSEPAVEEPATVVEEPAPVVEAEAADADGIDFETDVAFEADDTVMFESAFEAEAAPAVETASVAAEEPAIEAAAPEQIEPTDAIEPPEQIEPIDAIEPIEPAIEAAPVNGTPVNGHAADDRALLPFTATVPVDLADLRRIAADNQW